MKAGLITSAALHVTVLGLGLLSFSSPVPLDAMQAEPLPVSLVPLADEMSVKQGDMRAAKADRPAPKPTRKPQEKSEAKNTGEGKVDTKMPFKPKEKPRETEATPPPAGARDARADLTAQEKPRDQDPDAGKASAAGEQPKPEPEQAKAAQKPAEETKEPKPAEKLELKPAVQAEAKPVEKTEPDPVKPDIAQKTPEPAPPLPEKVPLPDDRPQAVAKTAERKPPEKTKRPSAPAAKGETVEDILAMADNALVDKARTQGGGAKRSQEPAAFGGEKNINDNAAFQQTLNNIIGSCVARNWNLAAINGSTAYDLRVIARFRLNQNGTLDGEPEMAPGGGDSAQREIIAIQAREALKKCAPFALPADRYSQWHDVTINMKAFPD